MNDGARNRESRPNPGACLFALNYIRTMLHSS